METARGQREIEGRGGIREAERCNSNSIADMRLFDIAFCSYRDEAGAASGEGRRGMGEGSLPPGWPERARGLGRRGRARRACERDAACPISTG
jgi:hypothetical protein